MLEQSVLKLFVGLAVLFVCISKFPSGQYPLELQDKHKINL